MTFYALQLWLILILWSYWLISTSHTLLWTLRFSLSLLSLLIFIYLHNYTSYALQLCSNLITYYFFISTSYGLLQTFSFFFILLLFYFVFIHLLNYTSYELLCSPTMFAPLNLLFFISTSHALLQTISFFLSLFFLLYFFQPLNYTSYGLLLCFHILLPISSSPPPMHSKELFSLSQFIYSTTPPMNFYALQSCLQLTTS